MKKRNFSFESLDDVQSKLIKNGIVSQEQLQKAAQDARKNNTSLDRELIRRKFITEERLISFLGEKVDIPYVNLDDYSIDPKVIGIVSEKIARRYCFIPVFMIENRLTIAMSDPLNFFSLGDIHALLGNKVEPIFASEKSILKAIDRYYSMGEAKANMIENILKEIEESGEVREVVRGIEKTAEREAIRKKELQESKYKSEASDPPMIKLVNGFIAQALVEGSTDIHIEPKRDNIEIRFRIDGLLMERESLPIKFVLPIISRIKIMASLDITKKRTPQDGRIGLIVGERSVDVRVSTFPTMFGEKIVMRIFDKNKRPPELHEIGFLPDQKKLFSNVLNGSSRMILVTGPTGSGKTTTLYSTLSTMVSKEKNIMTIEDPIEYEMEGVNQGQIDVDAGMTFASTLRSFLRQDPDIILIGEIRDNETANIAVRAALTGHTVLSTLHTTDSIGAIIRLIDIGISPDLLASVVKCVVAQRLVRKLCPKCKKPAPKPKKLLEELRVKTNASFYTSTGCSHCNNVGYKGRVGIFEIFIPDREISLLISKNSPEHEIRKKARDNGMKILLFDAINKCSKGITSIDEIMRVIEKEYLNTIY